MEGDDWTLSTYAWLGHALECGTIFRPKRLIFAVTLGDTVMIATDYLYITTDEQGVPWIAGAPTKLVELILDTVAYGWSPEELHFQHPHLSMGQIHSALAYYWDHKQAIDADIERRLVLVDDIHRTVSPTRLDERLRAKGLL